MCVFVGVTWSSGLSVFSVSLFNEDCASGVVCELEGSGVCGSGT